MNKHEATTPNIACFRIRNSKSKANGNGSVNGITSVIQYLNPSGRSK
jgi:hypothetical protein